MCEFKTEFKTGDEVLVSVDQQSWVSRIYLYDTKHGNYMCQLSQHWDRGSEAAIPYAYIKPAPRYETRVLGPVAMMQRLVDDGYEANSTGGWVSPDVRPSFNPQMWRYCGKPVPNEWNWHDSWLEKVEVKP